MFSFGFFLLPGIAASYTGPAVYLGYFAAGLPTLPSMFCMAEVSTAMPRAGGTYYFLDRSVGPLMGTVGGLGSWVAMIFKSAFALVGMGAFLALYVDVTLERQLARQRQTVGEEHLVGRVRRRCDGRRQGSSPV